jgi:hypothetical protein
VVNVDETAQWITALAADPAVRRKLGSTARQTVLRTYDWSAVLPHYRALWAEQLALLAKARAAPPRPSTAWRGYDPALIFAGFPSRRFDGSTRLTRGPHFDLWDELVKMPGTVVNPHVLVRSSEFNALRAAFADDRPRTVEEVVRPFPDQLRPLVFRALHWLIKIGLLRIVASGQAARVSTGN